MADCCGCWTRSIGHAVSQGSAKLGVGTAGVRKAKQEASTADRSGQKAIEKAQQDLEHASFRAVSERWMAEKKPSWAAETYRKARLVVNSYLVPKLGDLDMRTLETRDVRHTLIEMARDTPSWHGKQDSTSPPSWTTLSMNVFGRMKAG